MLSALKAEILSTAFYCCFEIQLAPPHLGDPNWAYDDIEAAVGPCRLTLSYPR